MVIMPFDRDALRAKVRSAKPYPFFCLDNFLDESFAEEVRCSFPSFEQAEKLGRKFSAVNEKNKIQITDSTKFTPPVLRLHEALASQEWLDTVGYVFDMPGLLADASLGGGGIHETGPRGHLDVHVDFNVLDENGWHRRLNILVYFNKDWKPEWGGNIELWDKDVKVCHHSLSPVFNRCVIFETNEISFHGVSAVKCPEGNSRKSFAAYYYTKEAPAHYPGFAHSTIFKARPDEKIKGNVLMPLENASRAAKGAFESLKKAVKPLIKPDKKD
ncbi:MAG: 2OG-Fe(II) oxygenase [Phycisphaeraceae bacterium]|nr:2OG-Fe(II) oxygenase [Phycisphaeraceae bacterium]